jgi:hypothetical protein
VAIRPLSRFWPAEAYHQNYARRNGLKYKYYRWSCGRDRRLEQVWGKRARSGTRWLARGEAEAAQLSTTASRPVNSAQGLEPQTATANGQKS